MTTLQCQNVLKYIIQNGIKSKIPSYLTAVKNAIQTKLKNNETFDFFKNKAIVKTNIKKNKVQLIPSIDINNNLGSTAIIKLPSNANFTLTNFLKIKNIGMTVIVDSTTLVIL